MNADEQRWHAHQAALYLDHVKGMSDRIKGLNWSIEELEAVAGGIKAIDYSKDSVQVSATDGAMTENIAKLIELKEDRERKRRVYEAELEAVTRALDRMRNQSYAALLDMHYIGGATWQEVADELHYSKRGILKVRQKALAMFYDHMPQAQRFADVPKALEGALPKFQDRKSVHQSSPQNVISC